MMIASWVHKSCECVWWIVVLRDPIRSLKEEAKVNIIIFIFIREAIKTYNLLSLSECLITENLTSIPLR